MLQAMLLLTSLLAVFIPLVCGNRTTTPDFRYLGGNGPYVSHDLMGISPDTPANCSIDQVVMLSRHGERYPISIQAAQYDGTVRKLKGMKALTGPLEFVTAYTPFYNHSDLGSLTSTGPYNGVLEAGQLGQQFRQRYGSLLSHANNSSLNILASKSDRVVETATYFAKGLFNNDTSRFTVVQVPEVGGGINSLTPEYNCLLRFDLLAAVLKGQEFLDANAGHIVDRLKKHTEPALVELNTMDVASLMGLCAFELSAKGSSDFCALFDAEDWKVFDYYNSLLQFYAFGPSTNASNAAGYVFANATMTLLKQGPQEMGNLYFNFAHDVNILELLGSLGMFVPDPPELSAEHIPVGNPFNVGQLVPMMAHVVFERMTCAGVSYVRLVLNDAPIGIPDCQSGPGRTCPLEEFEQFVKSRYISYADHCGTSFYQKPYFDLFWQHSNK